MCEVWVVQEVWSDGEEDNLSHYDNKAEAEKAYKETVENLQDEWGDCEDFEIYSNEDVSILQFSEHEVTIYLKEMPLKKAKIPRFFAEKELADEVQITEEEIKGLDELEYLLCHDFGLGDIAGGYVTLTIIGVDEELLEISIESGVSGESCNIGDTFYFNRETLKIEP
jgi:hypothetical protein